MTASRFLATFSTLAVVASSAFAQSTDDLGIATVFVTHDQEEALSLPDRIVAMSEGRVEQTGTPFEICNRPATRFVAPSIRRLNVLDMRVVDAAAGAIHIRGRDARAGRRIPSPDGADCALALRPEAVSLHHPGNGCNRIGGTVEDAVASDRIVLDRLNSPGLPPPVRGERVTLHFSPDDLAPLDAA